MSKNILKNMYTALITPFKDDYSVDYDSLKVLLKKQEQSKIDGIVLLSTTGEGATLTIEEGKQIIKIAKSIFSRDIIIGIAENDPLKVIYKMRQYDKFNPLAYLICSPFYNKGNELGIYEFYKLIVAKSKYPIILYNVPSRCGYEIPLKIIKKLKREEKIIGIKNASYSYKYYVKLAKEQNKNFKVLCGNDDFFFVGISLTNSGLISVSTNIIPNYFVNLFNEFNINYQKFKQDYFKLESLFTYLSLDVNPIMIKELISRYSFISDSCRLPLLRRKHPHVKTLIKKFEKNERIKYECNNYW